MVAYDSLTKTLFLYAALPLCLPRVGFDVGPLELGDVVVRIDLRRTQRTVAQEFLYLSHIGPVVQKVRCEGMAQNVRRGLALDSTLPQKTCHTALHIAARDRFSTL